MKLTRNLRLLIAVCVAVAFITLQMIESTHHHKSEAAHDACAVCQVIAHQPIDLSFAIVAPIGALLFFLFALFQSKPVFLILQADQAYYHSRAPPEL
jgi:hypothetical protein